MKKINVNRMEAMKLAWAIKRQQSSLPLAQCQVAAWKVLRLQQALRRGSVRFSFQKRNGEVREAVGTLKRDLFVQPPRIAERSVQLTLVRYFDIEKNAIRSFRADQILQVAA